MGFFKRVLDRGKSKHEGGVQEDGSAGNDRIGVERARASEAGLVQSKLAEAEAGGQRFIVEPGAADDSVGNVGVDWQEAEFAPEGGAPLVSSVANVAESSVQGSGEGSWKVFGEGDDAEDFKADPPMRKEEVLRLGVDESDERWEWLGDCMVLDGDLFEGICYTLYDNGELQEYEHFKKGFPYGSSYTFYESGKVKSYEEKVYSNLHGIRLEWDEDGALIRQQWYEYLYCVKSKERQADGSFVYITHERTDFERKIQQMAKERHRRLDEKGPL